LPDNLHPEICHRNAILYSILFTDLSNTEHPHDGPFDLRNFHPGIFSLWNIPAAE